MVAEDGAVVAYPPDVMGSEGVVETLTRVVPLTVVTGGSVEVGELRDLAGLEREPLIDEGGWARLVCPLGHRWSSRADELHGATSATDWVSTDVAVARQQRLRALAPEMAELLKELAAEQATMVVYRPS
jgi:hypothetical protein